MAAINASMIFQGASGRRYSIDVFIPDTASTLVNFSQAGAAGTGTPNFWLAPESVVLIDLAGPMATLATTVALSAFADDTPMGQILRLAQYVNTLATRPNPGVGWQKGRKISFTTV